MKNQAVNFLLSSPYESFQTHFEYRYRNEAEFWEIVIYPTPVELKGGIVEGTVVSPGFSLDLQQLINVFDRVDEINWRS